MRSSPWQREGRGRRNDQASFFVVVRGSGRDGGLGNGEGAERGAAAAGAEGEPQPELNVGVGCSSCWTEVVLSL